jgi:methenyltetrahydromethanopterin cyclohydrolase
VVQASPLNADEMQAVSRYNDAMTTLNERAWELCDAMIADAERLGVMVSTLPCGTRLIDCGVKAPGGVEAGLKLAGICMSGLGTVEIIPDMAKLWDGPGIRVVTKKPVWACMASQYAGWEIKGDGFFAMGSGPMRAAAGREALFDDIGYREQADCCVGVLETSKLPPASVCVDIASKSGIKPERLTLLVARTSSAAGTVQIVARSVETALHKLHVLGYDINQITEGSGSAPIPPLSDDDLTAIGRTNDAILYGGAVKLYVYGDGGIIDEIGDRVPSSASPDYGRPFAEIFRRYNGDFYRIDPMLFSPATVKVCTDHGLKYVYGDYAPDVLAESFRGLG